MISATLLALSLSQSQNLSYRDRFPLPDATVPSGWGVNIHFTDPQPGEMEKMALLGIKWVRMDLFWSQVEKQKGQYDFSAYDRLMGHLTKHKIRPLLILDYGNKLYEDGAPKSQDAQDAFVRFARSAVSRYQGQGVLWEMWNEPNLAMFWQPEPNVELYSKLALSVGKAIREIAPDEWYIGPATSGFDWSFIDGAFSRGTLKYFDAVSVHPYRQTQPETTAADWQQLRSLVDRHSPAKNIPLLSGEWGYSDIWQGQNPQLKADYVARQYLSNLASGVNLSIYYDWKNDGTDPKEPEHHFGILNHDLAEKPASKLLGFISKELSGFRFATDLSRSILPGAGDEARILLFTKGSEVRLAVWSETNRPLAVKLPLNKIKATQSSIKGRETIALDPSRSITLTGTPQIIIPAAADPWLRGLAQLPGSRTSRLVKDESEAVKVLSSWLEKISRAKGKNLAWMSGSGPEHEIASRISSALPSLPNTAEAQLKAATEQIKAAYGIGGAITFTASILGSDSIRVEQSLILNPAVPLSLDLGATPGSLILQNPQGWKGSLDLSIGAVQTALKLDGSLVQNLGQYNPKTDLPFLSLKGRIVSVTPNHKVKNLFSAPPEFQVFGEGDSPPESLCHPDSSEPGTWIYKSVFPQGWSYSFIKPALMPLLAESDRQIISYGVEVEGDGSGSLLRSRFIDSQGQVFQPNGVSIDWKGWRLVRFRVSAENAGWWGGPANGTINWPVRLESLLLLDSAKRLAGAASIRFRNPHILVPASIE